MVEKRTNIDNLFKDYLVGHHANAPANAWSRLNSELHPSRSRTFVFYTRLAAAAILLLVAFGAGYFYSEFNKPVNDEVALAGSNLQTEQIQEKSDNNLNDISVKEEIKTSVFQNNPTLKTHLDQKALPEQQTTESAENQKNIAENIRQSQKDIVTSDNHPFPVPEKIVVSEDETTAINPENADQMQNPVATETQQNVLKQQPEVMTPEMLHNLLVVDDSYVTDNLSGTDSDKAASLWCVGGRISPVYSYRTINGSGFETPEDNVEESYFNEAEEGILAMAGGISLNYNFSDQLSLASGLYVSRIGQANNDVVAYDDPNGPGSSYKLATSAGTVTINPKKFEMVMIEQPPSVKDSIPGDYLVNASFVQNMDYLEVPFVLNYKLLDRKISLILNGGLSPGILVNNRSYFEVDGQKLQTGTTENLNPFIYNSVMGLGFEYSISNNLTFNFEPTFKYSLSPINSNSGIKYHPYSMSWFTGISYKL